MNDIIKDNLQRFREECGLTQEQVAVLADVPVDSLRRWESKGGIKPAALSKLAEIYGRQVDHFMTKTPPKVEVPQHRVALVQISDDVDPEIIRKIQKLIDQANATVRDFKKAKGVK
jgi:transcriptional regulator with XRE-family HTH domain